MVRNILDALHKSFTYIMKRSVPNIHPWGTPNIILRLNVAIAPVFINGSLFERLLLSRYLYRETQSLADSFLVILFAIFEKGCNLGYSHIFQENAKSY